jgi:hypothetical protein
MEELKESKLHYTIESKCMSSCRKIYEATSNGHLQEGDSDRAIDTNLRYERAGDRILRIHIGGCYLKTEALLIGSVSSERQGSG